MTAKPTFGIFAPSSYARIEKFEKGLERLRAFGHDLIIHPQAYGRLGETQSAGTVPEKITALYDLIANPKVDMVMCACGGNTAIHLLAHLDYDKIKRAQKPLIGFSDATALLNAIYTKTTLITYHGPMVTFLGDDRLEPKIYPQMIDTLTTPSKTTLDFKNATIQKSGRTQGILLGGNLEVFRALVGTFYLPDIKNAILFFEDTGLELNHFDRTLCSLKLAGLFDQAAGLIFGQFTDMLDTGRPFGFTLDQIIAEHTRDLNIPVITNAPFGHSGMLPTFPIGATVTLDALSATPFLRILP